MVTPDGFNSMHTPFKYILLIAVSIIYSFGQEAKVIFSGVVKDTNGVILPYATVRIYDSTIGTICDNRGKYELMLPSGSYQIVFSYVGFASQTISVKLFGNLFIEICLIPNDILLPEVVIDGEDPAYSIVREAIRQKIKRRQWLSSFMARTYTKDTFGRDTSLSLISEAYSDLYYRKDDSLREIVVHRRQSSNLPEEFQFAIIRDFLDFNNDTLRHWGYTFITPLAESAFQFYDYKLYRTTINEGKQYYNIKVIPLSETLPLFSGMITIEDSSYALQQVKVSPNNIFQVPLLSLRKFEFSQQFELYDGKFWMPLEYHISAEVRFRFFNIMIDTTPSYYNKSVICYEYRINTSINDSIRSLPSLTLLPTSYAEDTSHWKNSIVFPLTSMEKESYKEIDEFVKSQPLYTKFPIYIKQYEERLKYIDVRYNRAEGLFLGGILPYTISPS
ncbi:MAG: DUF5686 family protein, partial [Bacteroidota bacterium]